MSKQILHTAMAMLIGAAAVGAHADTIQLNSYTYGGNSISSNLYSGGAGGFSGTLNGNSFQTYCVQLNEVFSFGNLMSNYTLIAGEAMTPALNAGWTHAASTSAEIAKLMTYVQTSGYFGSDDSNKSTALQLAIWNSIYDTDATVSSGSFNATGTNATILGYANNLLAGAALVTTPMVKVWVLNSLSTDAEGAHQDFLLTTPVPEPSTYALMAAGLGAIGFVARRRRIQA